MPISAVVNERNSRSFAVNVLLNPTVTDMPGITTLKFTLATLTAILAASANSAHAQGRERIEILPAGSAPVSGPVEFSNGLPIGVPETTGGIHGEQQLPFNSPQPWMHGYFQEIPSYGGFGAFRPYNYKHILSQSQAAGGWGMSPRMPYSQQFWHRYRHHAAMRRRP